MSSTNLKRNKNSGRMQRCALKEQCGNNLFAISRLVVIYKKSSISLTNNPPNPIKCQNRYRRGISEGRLPLEFGESSDDVAVAMF